MMRSNPKNALEEACKTIVELCGTCPAEHYGIGYDGCAERCRPDIETECWKDYFTGERWTMSDYNDYLLPEPCLRLDFGFGEQYPSIELGDGTGYLRLRGSEDRETELRERIASLNAENVDLGAENAKLREENKRLMCVAVKHYTELLNSDDVLGQIMARKKLKELGIKVDS